MPRIARVAVGNMLYHVINRANGRAQIFYTDNDYQHFESILADGKEMINMRIVAYCIMPNHWHLVLYPKNDTDMGEYMRWITTTHVRQRRAQTKSIGQGHLYQGTYKSFPVETNEYAQQLIRYVEQNPLRAQLVTRAEDWRWSSLWRREKGGDEEKKLLSPLPIELPADYLEFVNMLSQNKTLDLIRTSVNKGTPFGSEHWMNIMVQKFGLESTLRKQGRPKKVVL
ncbi:MAG: putative transposase [Parcubacteria group bacterium Gr01-1014_48]|nr:MAG: putative transposase [Parcubacteria group bacterium Greene0416_14]TSC73837.1 MAG: putative transposase [Parcubacteria group bacterium Gr01-1014_48]TSD01218.1 MAG: putative transposase [Parcubacteria group bacterium Greene1014_15]TSD08317.1 MAG: putative transposase [Parcubacteria group bacterium Greene0714_4]